MENLYKCICPCEDQGGCLPCGEGRHDLQKVPAPAPAQGTPEPPKVAEFVQTFLSRLAGLTEEQSSNVAETLSHMLRPYFPPASQTSENIQWCLGHMTKLRNAIFATIPENERTNIGDDFIEKWPAELARRATPASTARTDGWVSVPHDLLMELRGVVVGEWNFVPLESDKAKYLHTLWTQIDAIRFPAAPGSVPQAPDNHSDLFFGNLQYSLQTLFAKVGDPFKDLAEWGAVWEALESARKHFGVPQAEPPKSELEEMRHQLKVKDIAATAIAVVLRAKCSDREWDNLPEEMRVQTDRVTELVERTEAAEKRVKELAGDAQPGDAPQKEKP